MRTLQRDQPGSTFTWEAPCALAARLEVPVAGAWERMSAGQKRRQTLEAAFSSQAAAQGEALGLHGPSRSGKTQAALGLADLRGLRAVYATRQTDQQAFRPAAGMLVIIDPVSAYQPEEVQACVDYYASSCPVVAIDRDEDVLSGLVGLSGVMRLRMPSSDAISAYLQQLLGGYPHQLQPADFEQLGQAMQGLSLPQVNQVAVDAALSRLQYGQSVDRHALDSSLQAMGSMKAGQQ